MGVGLLGCVGFGCWVVGLSGGLTVLSLCVRELEPGKIAELRTIGRN